jgi:acid stress chaperone HdeB
MPATFIFPGKGTAMKTISALLVSLFTLSAVPANAVVLDLSTMSCKQFVESSSDEIKMVLTWMDGWYKGDSDDAIIDTEVFVENAKKFGSYCASHPTVSIVTAAEKVLGE